MNPLAPPETLDAAAVLRDSGTNFAAAFLLLDAERRRDLETLYAFCRRADDIADEEGPTEGARRTALAAWRSGFRHPDFTGLPADLRDLIRRRQLPPALFLELLDGVEGDLAPRVRMQTRDDLNLYCHRVAGTVGLLCLTVFGAQPERAAAYAETLGRALQCTNILRDTASDLQRDRLYHPLDALAAAGLDDESFRTDSAARQKYLEGFASEAEELFDEAARLLPPGDASVLRPARVMAGIYRALLGEMRVGGLRVMEKRYRLSTAAKLRAAAAALAGQ